MSDVPLIVVPGQWPPDLIPFCGFCDLPCERIEIRPFTEPNQDYLIIDAQCCGHTSGSHVPLRAVWDMKAAGTKWYAIVKKGRWQGAREQKKTDFQGMHG